MIASHLQTMSKQPAQACTVPTAPDFITTFQCFGQFFQTILGSLNAGFGTLTDAGLSVSGLLSTVLLLFAKGFPIETDRDIE